ncbi:MAG: alkaline phosphatase family protein, partial [Proteobacteria bacterium]|nr:alkaline phosphatase family protein [Pseudomonadota bacterium]
KENLKPYIDRIKNPHPRGLKWILHSQNGKQGLNVGFPSITAPSHISSLTCSKSGSHGVFLNGGNWNGVSNQNGFAMPIKTEIWAKTLKDAGYKVAVAAYPSLDGSSPDRAGDIGIAYDSPTGKYQYVKLSKAQDPSEGESAEFEVASRFEKDRKYKFKINRTPGAKATVTSDFLGSQKLTLNEGKVVDAFGVDGIDSDKRTASVSFMDLGVQSETSIVAVSPLSVMPVTGSKLKQVLDSKNIVWSNMRDYGLANYKNGDDFMLESVRHRRKAELAGIQQMLALNSSDALFAYFEDIDVLLHAWIGLPEMDQKIADYLSEFDQDLGQLIQSLPQSTNIVAVGDHGMTPVDYEINVRMLLPENLLNKFQVRVSGGALFLYPAGDLSGRPDPETNLDSVVQALKDARVEFDGNRPVFNKVFTRYSDQARSLGIHTDISPWIMAFADDRIGLQNRLENTYLVSRRQTFSVPEVLKPKYPDPMNSGKLVLPIPMGAHGHDSDLASMKSFYFLKGNDFVKSERGSIRSNTDLVPVIADALGWPRPLSCK